MTRTGETVAHRRHTAGDAAVDGLLAGGAAGIAMGAYLAASGLLLGEGPARMLARFDPAGSAEPVAGALMHLAVSAVYGLVFGVIYRLVGRGRLVGRPAGMLLGLVYGLVLVLLAQGLVATPAGAALRGIPTVHFAIAHLVYGVVLGWLVARS